MWTYQDKLLEQFSIKLIYLCDCAFFYLFINSSNNIYSLHMRKWNLRAKANLGPRALSYSFPSAREGTSRTLSTAFARFFWKRNWALEYWVIWNEC